MLRLARHRLMIAQLKRRAEAGLIPGRAELAALDFDAHPFTGLHFSRLAYELAILAPNQGEAELLRRARVEAAQPAALRLQLVQAVFSAWRPLRSTSSRNSGRTCPPCSIRRATGNARLSTKSPSPRSSPRNEAAAADSASAAE